MKHILIVDVSNSVGGIETLFFGLFGKKQNFFRVSFLTYSEKCAFEDDYVSLGYEVYHLRSRKEIPLNFSKQIKTFFQQHQDFDYIWVNTASTSMYQCQLYAKRYTNAKIITHSHGTKFEKSSSMLSFVLNLLLEKVNYHKVVKNTDMFFCCSIMAGVSLFGEKYRDRLVLIRNGIDVDKNSFSKEKRDNIRKQLKINDDEIVIGLIGRISNQKNPLKAVRIFSNYTRLNSRTKLLVIGDGNLKSEVRALIESEKIEDKVVMLGYRQDVSELLSAIDFLLMPSLFEGLPLTAIEAQANGVPCFLSSTITNEVAVTDLVTFISLEETDEGWAKKIRNAKVVSDRKQYKSIVHEKKYDIRDTLLELQLLLN